MLLAGDMPLEGCRVLVVEDDPIQALDLNRALRELGCGVLGPAGSRAEAAGLLARERPSLALLDLLLRDGDALPVAELLVAADVPFALATAHDGALLEHLLLRGCPRLRKPYGQAELRAFVRGLRQLDGLKSLARLDERIAQTWDRIAKQAGALSRLAADGRDTREIEAVLRAHEEIAVMLEARREHVLGGLEAGHGARWAAERSTAATSVGEPGTTCQRLDATISPHLPAAAAPSTFLFEGCTALVVEGEPTHGQLLEQTLRTCGCAVLGPAGTRAEALDLLRQVRPSLALLAARLPDGDALPVAAALVARRVPFAVLTANGGVGPLVAHPLLRQVPRLSKSCRPAELHRSIRELRRVDLQEQLAVAERQLAQGRERFARQLRSLRRLAAGGYRTEVAEGLLRGIARSLQVMRAHRAHLRRQLAGSEGSR